MFTVSSDGTYAKLSTWVVSADNPADVIEWQFDEGALITGASASHVFQEPGWHSICMRSCSGTVETQVCSAIDVDSYVVNSVQITQAPTTVAQGVQTGNFQLCLSSVCPPPYVVDLLALETSSCNADVVPDNVWSGLIPQHVFYDPDGNSINSLTLEGDPLVVSGVAVGYEACACFTYRDDLPGSVQITANYEPACEICRAERPEETLTITNPQIGGGVFEYEYSSSLYSLSSEPFPAEGFFGSTSFPWASGGFLIAENDKNGRSLQPLKDVFDALPGPQVGTLTFKNGQTNTGVSGIFTGLTTYTSVSGHDVYSGSFIDSPPDFLPSAPVDGQCYALSWTLLQDQPECPVEPPSGSDIIEVLLETSQHQIYDPFNCETRGNYPNFEELSGSSLPNMSPVELVDMDADELSYLYLSYPGSMGYSKAAQGYAEELRDEGNTVQFMDITNDAEPPTEPYNTVILHSHPRDWELYLNRYRDEWAGCRIIGNTVWETEVLPIGWAHPCSLVDEIWLPTEWNAKTLRDSGITTPITVKPHVFTGGELGDPADTILRGYRKRKGEFVFYSIGVWDDPRKNTEALVRAYCDTFTKKDNVSLILKTSVNGSDLKLPKSEVDAIRADYDNPPKITTITIDYTDEEIADLHTVGHCFVSFTHTEGWGLGAFDAHNYGNPVIITGYGGQVSYLGEDYPGLIDYKMVPCDGSPDFPSYHQWAEPDAQHASELMQELFSIF